MISNKIGINLLCQNITLNKSTTFRGNSAGVEADTLTLEDSLKPPVISDEQLKKNKITDEQIIQMNKSKKLPNNAKLKGVPLRTKGLGFEPAFEDRFHYEVVFCYQTLLEKNALRDIPKGYVVARGPKNKVFVVKEEDTIPNTVNH